MSLDLSAPLQLLSDFQPIGLEETTAQAALLRRVDTKYVIPPSKLADLLIQWAATHRVLEVNGQRISHYKTVYYDTPQLDLYKAHHAGASSRVKLRVRAYTDYDLSFYEVKVRSNHGVTDKKRVRLVSDDNLPQLLSRSRTQHPRHLQAAGVQPVLQVEYDRITLVSKSGVERITIDLGLTYRNREQVVVFDDRVIIEVKHERGMRTRTHELFRRLGFHPGSISKYCLGVISLYPQVKQNRFKMALRILAKQLRPK